MYNDDLAADYLRRAASRLRAVQVLAEEESWADVVRESQEIVEITLKALLRLYRIEVPRIHDVSPVLLDNRDLFPADIRDNLKRLTGISKALRRDRELAFYGSEDLTPSQFYAREDAEEALDGARWVHSLVAQVADSGNAKARRRGI
jgi:HEPN domain-containing protein